MKSKQEKLTGEMMSALYYLMPFALWQLLANRL
jgi:hypothetical protein